MEKTDLLRRYYDGVCDDAYGFFGCHPDVNGGYVFRVFAPDALSVRVVGSFNGWRTDVPVMDRIGGVWEQTVPDAADFDSYKYYIETKDGGFIFKSDPFGFHMEMRPETASKVYDISGFDWHDAGYYEKKKSRNIIGSPVNIYELHIGSWRKYADGNQFSYRHFADEIVPYVKEMGYTHIELLPVSEYPLDDSWGYQVSGYYAPTSRYGTPHDFMYLIDKCHRAGIGVILDWVGAHFPKDESGLYRFDGDYLYESPDPLLREHPEWGTCIFDYSRNEVRSFLISNVCFWIREYHIDGIRADAVASMLYLDYGRQDGWWRADSDGGKINRNAVKLLRDMNSAAFAADPTVMMIAEESTAFPMVTKPGYDGGLGFNFKWNMGWMHDTLDYFSADPLMRKGLHDKLTFSMTYAFSENYVLPISHDEVVHGKLSVIGRMPGDYGAKFDNLRAMYAYMIAHPGKKLNFMGNELGQFIEWDCKKELDWLLLSYDKHRQFRQYVKEINRFYRDEKPLWENDTDWDGFRWIRVGDRDNSVIVFRRIDRSGDEIIAVFNFCPVPRYNYRIGVPKKCILKPVFSSDEERFGGNGTVLQRVKTYTGECDGLPMSAELYLPPMSATFYKMIYAAGK